MFCQYVISSLEVTKNGSVIVHFDFLGLIQNHSIHLCSKSSIIVLNKNKLAIFGCMQNIINDS